MNRKYKLGEGYKGTPILEPILENGEVFFTDVHKHIKDKKSIPYLNSEYFNYENHTWDNSIISYKDAIGYCESEKVRLRPKEKSYAVMFFNVELEQFWFHIPDWVFENYFIKEEGCYCF